MLTDTYLLTHTFTHKRSNTIWNALRPMQTSISLPYHTHSQQRPLDEDVGRLAHDWPLA